MKLPKGLWLEPQLCVFIEYFKPSFPKAHPIPQHHHQKTQNSVLAGEVISELGDQRYWLSSNLRHLRPLLGLPASSKSWSSLITTFKVGVGVPCLVLLCNGASVKTMLWEIPPQHTVFWLVSNLTMLRSEGQLQHCGKALMHL